MSIKIDVSADSPSAVVAVKSGLFATEGSADAECDCLLEELNYFKIENE